MLTDAVIERIATQFMLNAVQEWGDAPKRRIAAVQAVLDAAKFEAIATCWPVFGAIWPKPCGGSDADEATTWLKNLTDSMERGDVNEEIQHVVAEIVARRK